MSRKRRSKEDEIVLEAERLDDALDELVDQLGMKLAMADSQPAIAANQAKIRRDAALAIATLSARKAALLGLDAPEVKPAAETGEAGTLAELERKLALVAPGKAS